MNKMTNLPLAASGHGTSGTGSSHQHDTSTATSDNVVERKEQDSKVKVSLDDGTLRVQLSNTQAETLEQAYNVLRKHAPTPARGAVLDLHRANGDDAPQGDEFKKLLSIGKLYGSFLADSGLKLVVLFNPDNSVSELFGALAAQHGGRVLATSDTHEARDWLAGKLK